MKQNNFYLNCFSENFERNICKECGYDLSNSQQSGEYLAPSAILTGKYMTGKVLDHGGF